MAIDWKRLSDDSLKEAVTRLKELEADQKYVIPSEVEESRCITLRERHGILRLRFRSAQDDLNGLLIQGHSYHDSIGARARSGDRAERPSVSRVSRLRWDAYAHC